MQLWWLISIDWPVRVMVMTILLLLIGIQKDLVVVEAAQHVHADADGFVKEFEVQKVEKEEVVILNERTVR